jgi:hypothetical protein
LQAQGRRMFDSIVGSGQRRLGEDDNAAGPGMVRVIRVAGLGTTRGAQRCELGEADVVVGSTMASWA